MQTPWSARSINKYWSSHTNSQQLFINLGSLDHNRSTTKAFNVFLAVAQRLQKSCTSTFKHETASESHSDTDSVPQFVVKQIQKQRMPIFTILGRDDSWKRWPNRNQNISVPNRFCRKENKGQKIYFKKLKNKVRFDSCNCDARELNVNTNDATLQLKTNDLTYTRSIEREVSTNLHPSIKLSQLRQ